MQFKDVTSLVRQKRGKKTLFSETKNSLKSQNESGERGPIFLLL